MNGRNPACPLLFQSPLKSGQRPRKAQVIDLKRNWRRVTFRLRRLIQLLGPVYLAQRHRFSNSGLAYCAGIAVARKPFDFLFNSTAFIVSAEDYESGLVQAIRTQIRPDDRVCIVGGGLGVTAALAGSLAKSVVCYEASKPFARISADTALLNGLTNVKLVEAVVGLDVAVYGKQKSDHIMPAEALEDCDLLEMDCEGAEATILRHMTIRPRVIVVETHGLYGAPTDMIASLLRDKGYSVQNLGIAETRFAEMCRKADIMCLVGLRSEKHEQVAG